jgi:anaerobic magnesium-protoporphyrin IX monomethyl ester cyclase
VALIGAELEENLSIRYLASSVGAAGFRTGLYPINSPDQLNDVVASIVDTRPMVVGISVPFQQHARELLDIATALRAMSFTGHISAGGHFVTFEHTRVLRDWPAIDSIVRHEGEGPLVELCRRVRDGRPVAGIPGIVTRNKGGEVVCAPRHRLPELDDLPYPDRRGDPHEVLGIPCSPILGSRGCYGDCTFCCINAYHRNAKGPRYRRRSPEFVVDEMRREYERRGVRLFIFHDDNFFLPTRGRNFERYRKMGELLQAAGLDDVGFVIKCRPNDVDPELFELLVSIGLVRAYVGIETNSGEGLVSLNRRVTSRDNERALETLRDLGVYCSFNVLIFDPEATFAGVEKNLDFMEAHADVPFNFCRAEVYAGTALERTLRAQRRLEGDYLAWNYTLKDPRVELLFRIVTTAFSGRNFKAHGIANLNMGIRFDSEVMRRFYPEAWDPTWQNALVDFSARVGRDSTRHFRRAVQFARSVRLSDFDAVNRFTLDLARGIARADMDFLQEIKRFRDKMERRVFEAYGVRAGKQHDRGMHHEDIEAH